jgi:hypothetical protein
MKLITEFLYKMTDLLPLGLKDCSPFIGFRNKLRHLEIVRRTADLVENPAYKSEIENRELKVLFVSPIFNSFPLLAVSLIDQTYENWELLFVHDGPSDQQLTQTARAIIESDKRIRISEQTIGAYSASMGLLRSGKIDRERFYSRYEF